MPKIIALSLAASVFAAPACDPEVDAVQFRDAQTVATKFPEIDYARKSIEGCFWSPSVAAVTLTSFELIDGLQGFTITIESNAPMAEVDCFWSVLADWEAQP